MDENNNNEIVNQTAPIENGVQAKTDEIALGNNNAIKIADDVVSIIAGKAVSEISGVAGMAGGFAGWLRRCTAFCLARPVFRHTLCNAHLGTGKWQDHRLPYGL